MTDKLQSNLRDGDPAAAELRADVLARGNYWDAYDQGRYAFLIGERRNPHLLYPGYSHVNVWDWQRGWDHQSRTMTAQTEPTSAAGA